MTDSGPTWIVLVRDLSGSVQVQDQPEVIASLVLDADTGLARGVSVAATAAQACEDAMQMALTKPAGPLPPQPPAQVVHGEADEAVVRAGLAATLAPQVQLELFPAAPIPEAEDILDSFVGHLLGRAQPNDPPGPPDWERFYAVMSDFEDAEPWLRWSDADHLALEVRLADGADRFVAVVMGNAGLQRGLALYPGDAVPAGMTTWSPGDPVPLPAGALMIWLDPAQDTPAEYAAKAYRYGWPESCETLPFPLAVDGDGPGDVDRLGLATLTVAVAAVVAHDRRHRGPLPLEEVVRPTDGSVWLDDDHCAQYTIG